MVGGTIRLNQITGPYSDLLLVFRLKTQILLLGWTLLYTVLWLLAVVGMPMILLSCESNTQRWLISCLFLVIHNTMWTVRDFQKGSADFSQLGQATNAWTTSIWRLWGVLLRLTFWVRLSSWVTGSAFGQPVSETRSRNTGCILGSYHTALWQGNEVEGLWA